ncbi:uncharacterized protein PAC_01069 [Phialocephala subalpina]|uniref:Uncharacterized protein n=1 Tax=Phialocephala subalpina TaxID=576137 RepID=A0A1L7WEK9_9HELO|nr:uncharacterized protein PAC_01069 [Phialocephala subalpina]
MAPVQPPAPTKQSTAEMAANTMWEYQLRKENKAILDQIRKYGEKRDADVAENMKRFQEVEKRRLALEARVTELERDQKLQDAHAAEHKKECAAKLAEMENFLKGRVNDEELRKIMSGGQYMNPPAQTTSDPQPSRVAPRPSNAKPRPARADTQDPRQEAIANQKAVRSPQVDDAPATRPKQVANRRPATRSTSGERAVPTAKPITATSVPSTTPKLSQGRKALKQHYEIANAAFESLTITNPQMEYDFISAFISGLQNKKHAEKVIQALRAVHPAKNRMDGGVEIMCGWEDVAAGFKRAGLDVEGAKEEIKRKKRTLNPRTQLETGFSA